MGFGSSYIFNMEPQQRKSYLIKAGVIMISGFIVLRTINIYGDSNHWELQELGLVATILDFMNVSKYPPSLLFILITLGPMAILCAYADDLKGRVKDIMIMFGRVPFFFYVLHFALIKVLSIILGSLQGFDIDIFATPFFNYPKEFGINLFSVYLVWILVILILYLPCKWMAKIKRDRKDWWLSYL